jgi:hypothetical protein
MQLPPDGDSRIITLFWFHGIIFVQNEILEFFIGK